MLVKVVASPYVTSKTQLSMLRLAFNSHKSPVRNFFYNIRRSNLAQQICTIAHILVLLTVPVMAVTHSPIEQSRCGNTIATFPAILHNYYRISIRHFLLGINVTLKMLTLIGRVVSSAGRAPGF